MIFSVFDYNARQYNYFEAPGTSAKFDARGTRHRPLTQGPQGPRASSVQGLGGGRGGERVCIGYAPEALAMPLPSNARQVGSGAQARGIIATSAHAPLSGYSGVSGLGSFNAGLGAAIGDTVVTDAPDGKREVTVTTSLGKVIVAACVASVVGVVVQKILK